MKGSEKFSLMKHLEECVPDYEEIFKNRAKHCPLFEGDKRYHNYNHSADPYISLRAPSTVPCSVIRSIAMAFTILDEEVNIIDIFLFITITAY